jgi:prepilin signal peptidase PulO-like enzyme (type II secretory pathway)
MAGYIVVEVVMLKQGVSWIEGLYFGLGLAISGLATYLWMAEHRGHHFQIRHT